MIIKLSLLICLSLAGEAFAGTRPLGVESPSPRVNAKFHSEERSSSGGTRIVGGVEAEPHAWPHMASLTIDDAIRCVGSLISDEWVLTAGHCIDGHGHVDVKLGVHDINANEPSMVNVRSTDFFAHDDLHDHNDIGLIRLPEPLELTAEIQPIKLPSVDASEGDIVTAMGWGATGFISSEAASPRSSKPLMQVDVPVMSTSSCEAVYGHLGNSVICTDSTGGHGTCVGDSGGPIVRDGMIFGVTDFGSAGGCEAGQPDGYARVFYYLDWIKSNTGISP